MDVFVLIFTARLKMINLLPILCEASLTCVIAPHIDIPYLDPTIPYDTEYACYVNGTFYRQCPADFEIQYKLTDA
jgi:hypothetical protein